MELIEMLRNITVREDFEAGRSAQEISEERGLSVLEVLRREKDMHLIPANDVPATIPAKPAFDSTVTPNRLRN